MCERRAKENDAKETKCTCCTIWIFILLFLVGIVLGFVGVSLGVYLSNPTVRFDQWANPPQALDAGILITPLGEGSHRFEMTPLYYVQARKTARFPLTLESTEIGFTYVPLQYLDGCETVCAIRSHELDGSVTMEPTKPKVSNDAGTEVTFEATFNEIVSQDFVDDMRGDCSESEQLLFLMRLWRSQTSISFFGLKVLFPGARLENVAFQVRCN